MEEAIAARLYGGGATDDALFAPIGLEDQSEAAEAVRRMVLERSHRGTGGLRAWYPNTIAAWHLAHPGDAALDMLATRFCSSAPCRLWREFPAEDIGISLEEALYRFFLETHVGDAAILEEEFLSAILRSLAVAPRARFRWPPSIRRAPGGCFAVSQRFVLHAAIDGRYVCGEITPLVGALLSGEPMEHAARRFDIGSRELTVVLEKLRAMRLIAPCGD
jgi:hypothetical protein